MYSGPLDHNFLHRRGSSIADRWKREKRRIFAVLSCLKLRTHDGWCLQLTKSRVLQRTRAIGLRGSCAGPGRSNQNSVSITKKKNTHKYWMKLNRISSKQMLFKINISIIVYEFLTVSHKTCFFSAHAKFTLAPPIPLHHSLDKDRSNIHMEKKYRRIPQLICNKTRTIN